MIRVGITGFADFMEASTKNPSFLKSYDRAKVVIEDTCGAKVFSVDNVWDFSENFKLKFED